MYRSSGFVKPEQRYAEALGLRLHAGRVFNSADVQAGVRPMIVNEQFVREYLHNGPAVGRRFAELVPSADEHVATEIIGVIGNVLKDGKDQQPQPEVYFVHGSPGRRVVRWLNVVVRTKRQPD
jgi:hypothetical protein